MRYDETDTDPVFFKELPPKPDDDSDFIFDKAVFIIGKEGAEPRVVTEEQATAEKAELVNDLGFVLMWVKRELEHLRTDKNAPQPEAEKMVRLMTIKHGITL